MILRNIKYLFFLLLIASNMFYAQTRELDSLKGIVRDSKVDTLQIKAALDIGKNALIPKPDTSILYYNKA